MPRSLGLPTDTSHVAGGPVDLPSPHPLGINYRPVNLRGLRLPTHAQAASKWIRVSTVIKRSLIVGPAVYRTSRQREIQCSMPRNFFESRVSLTSLAQSKPAGTANWYLKCCRGQLSSRIPPGVLRQAQRAIHQLRLNRLSSTATYQALINQIESQSVHIAIMGTRWLNIRARIVNFLWIAIS